MKGKLDRLGRPSLGFGLALTATVLVLAAVTSGLLLVESPRAERGFRLDRQRIADLDHLARAINCYWTLEDELPRDLDTLVREMERLSRERPIVGQCLPPDLTDPETNDFYRYRTLSDATFELCATFALPSPQQPSGAPTLPRGATRSWIHEDGEHCFSVPVEEVARIREPA